MGRKRKIPKEIDINKLRDLSKKHVGSTSTIPNWQELTSVAKDYYKYSSHSKVPKNLVYQMHNGFKKLCAQVKPDNTRVLEKERAGDGESEEKD